MAIIAATQTIETSIDKTLSAVAGIIQRVINTHASDDITVTYGTNTADISAGQFVDFWYDGTVWRSSIIYVNPWAGNFEPYKNITAKPNASNPNYQVDIEWDSLYIEGILSTSGDFTIDITASGLLGLDTGSEASSTWYYLWAIAKADGTVSAILSASSTSPTMPAGYTLKRLVSMVRNNSSGNFVNFVQENEIWGYVANTIIKLVSTFISETLDARNWIPEKVNKAYVVAYLTVLDNITPPGNGIVDLYSYINGVYILQERGYAVSTTTSFNGSITISGLIGCTSRYIKYATIDSASATSVITELCIRYFEVPL